MFEFLDDTDNLIVEDAFAAYSYSSSAYVRFWSWGEIQLDGDFSLLELKAIVGAMELMEQRHKHGLKYN